MTVTQKSQRYRTAAQVAATVGATRCSNLTLCRCCRERPQSFGMADRNGNPLWNSSGYCYDCTPVQTSDDPGLEAEYIYRAKWYNPASQSLVEAAPIEGWTHKPGDEPQYTSQIIDEDNDIKPIDVTAINEKRKSIERRLKQLDGLKLQQEAKWQGLMAGTYGFDAGIFMDDMISASDEYNNLLDELYSLDTLVAA